MNIKMNKQRAILAAVLGLGLTALSVDRLVLDSSQSGPQAAAASAFAPVPSSSTAGQALETARVALGEAEAAADESLAQRIAAVADEHGVLRLPVRDAFAPGDAWQSNVEPDEPEQRARDVELQQFARNHQLMAIMSAGDRGVVVINGRPMRVGQQISGFLLVNVNHNTATFWRDGEQVSLKLNDE